MKLILAILSIAFLGFADNAHAKVVGTEVSYKDGDTTLKGYIAYDDAVKGKRPGILVVHEWWGHNTYARKRADMLAQMGYTALALDMYGVAVFHGHLPGHIKAQKGTMKAKLMVAHGADDPFLTKEQVAAFKREMAAAAVDLRFFSYPGAVHSFTNPEATEYGKKFNIPLAYNEQADKASWAELTKFLKEVFAK